MSETIQKEISPLEQHGHLKAEELSMRLFIAIAHKIHENPEPILANARKFIDEWRKTHPGSGGATYYLNRWESLLNGSIKDLISFMVSPSQDARDMRQAPPFVGVLSNRERWNIIREVSNEWQWRKIDAKR
jgi:hypothetical protein